MAAPMIGKHFATLAALFAALLLTFSLASAATVPSKWVLSYEGKSTNQFIWDPRTKGLVKHGVPARLANQILDALGGPPDPVFVTAQRYVSVSACIPHDCPEKGFFWIDTTTGSALGAYYESGPWLGEQPDGHFFGPGELTLGSKAFSAADIPAPARQALIDWLTEEDMWTASVHFIGKDGLRAALASEAFQPRPVFRPPASGPAFDCSGASRRIETTICGNAALSALDLKVAMLASKIRHGHDTVGGRDQLAEFQRAWRAGMNATCSGTSDMVDCLKASYQAQYERLMNWVPK